ncbi:MAG: glycosyltransferase family 2 protein [Gammaproteobacteria bacterium]|nr:MAG: glycosyltransferase family 2 protein [Gammaproteobacteria bacterium]RKZ69454.1 MAG: glycosyltransferase family 2 protein [Gammaproteobacteria bacterium]
MASVSVVIPTYNRVKLLERALASVLGQTLPADEIIIVDDGSTDNTVSTLKTLHPEVKFIQQDNLGVSAARNTGIAAARHDWIALLDSDDVWHKHKLERQMAALNNAPEYLICHSNEIWVRNGVRVNQMHKHKKAGGQIFQHCLPLCVISPSAVVMHRSLLEETGLFDESLAACEDYDLWLRICSRYPVLYIDEALITKHGGHDDQLSTKHWGMDRFRIHALNKIISENKLNDSDRDAAINMMVKKISIYLAGADKHGNTEHVEDFKRILTKYASNTVAA